MGDSPIGWLGRIDRNLSESPARGGGGAKPAARSAARPASLMRSVVHGSAKLMSTLTSSANSRSLSSTDSRISSDRWTADERRQQLHANPAVLDLDVADHPELDDG